MDIFEQAKQTLLFDLRERINALAINFAGATDQVAKAACLGGMQQLNIFAFENFHEHYPYEQMCHAHELARYANEQKEKLFVPHKSQRGDPVSFPADVEDMEAWAIYYRNLHYHRVAQIIENIANSKPELLRTLDRVAVGILMAGADARASDDHSDPEIAILKELGITQEDYYSLR